MCEIYSWTDLDTLSDQSTSTCSDKSTLSLRISDAHVYPFMYRVPLPHESPLTKGNNSSGRPQHQGTKVLTIDKNIYVTRYDSKRPARTKYMLESLKVLDIYTI